MYLVSKMTLSVGGSGSSITTCSQNSGWCSVIRRLLDPMKTWSLWSEPESSGCDWLMSEHISDLVMFSSSSCILHISHRRYLIRAHLVACKIFKAVCCFSNVLVFGGNNGAVDVPLDIDDGVVAFLDFLFCSIDQAFIRFRSS